MTKSSVSILSQDCKHQDEVGEDILLTGIRAFLQSLMETEVEQFTGAGKHEKSPERQNYRNGYREREWITRLGNILLRVLSASVLGMKAA